MSKNPPQGQGWRESRTWQMLPALILLLFLIIFVVLSLRSGLNQMDRNRTLRGENLDLWRQLQTARQEQQEQREEHEAWATVRKARIPFEDIGVLSVGGNAVGCPMNTYVLIRTDKGVGAVIFTEQEDSGVGEPPASRAKYRWFYRAERSGQFTDPGTESGVAEVFEKYRLRKEPDGKLLYEDEGGQLQVRCGPIVLEWSASNWLYLPEHEPCELAIVRTSEIREVDIHDPSLIWCGRKAPAPKAP